MSLYKKYAIDPEKAQNGVPVTLAANDDGTVPTFYLAQISKTNAKYMAAVDKGIKPLRRMNRGRDIPADDMISVNKAAFIKTCLLGWQNIQGPDGAVLEFNTANATKLFSDLPQLYFDLESFADDMTNFQADQVEEDVKNS